MMKATTVLIPMALVLLIGGWTTTLTFAEPLVVSGNAQLLTTPPTSVEADILESNTDTFVFLERTGLTLPSNLEVNIVVPGFYADSDLHDTQILPSGFVDSYFVHFDPVGTIPAGDPAAISSGALTFEEEVVAVITNGTQLWDFEGEGLAAHNTIYPALDGSSARGLDAADSDQIVLSPDRQTIFFNFAARGSTDQMRILTTSVIPEPAVLPDFQVSTFATLADPMRMTIDESGNLYVGRKNSGSGGSNTDPVHIYKVGPDGSVEEYGNDPLPGPNAVKYDANGLVGPAGSVLVGGVSQSDLFGVLSNETVVNLYSSVGLISDMAFDGTDRLVFITEPGRLIESVGGIPTTLVKLPSHGRFLAINGDSEIFTSTADGIIRVYDSDGNLINDDFASGLGCCTSLAFGPGGVWGDGLYGMSRGNLLKFDDEGNTTVVGTDLAISSSSYLLFDDQDALFISDFSGDRILKIVPIPEPSMFVLALLGGFFICLKNRRINLPPIVRPVW